QETFRRDKKDSVSVIRGTWSPSDGYIWLYKDQVVRARYTWQGDQLHYFSPQLKKTIGMSPMVDIMSNAVWKEKPKQGITLFGIGNEPFWSVEVNNRDSLFFLLSEWSQPVKLRIEDKKATADSVAYSAKNDSVSIRLSIYPLFCSDGMSDHVYKNKIRVRYNGTIYNGCGMLYKQ
ncbi:MAG TPA: hypothetical protein VEB42_16300, partial [Chitinophagaceae bacterium]|nr:hypothetical protein [Chitinophagaceae bacterium]